MKNSDSLWVCEVKGLTIGGPSFCKNSEVGQGNSCPASPSNFPKNSASRLGMPQSTFDSMILVQYEMQKRETKGRQSRESTLEDMCILLTTDIPTKTFKLLRQMQSHIPEAAGIIKGKYQ